MASTLKVVSGNTAPNWLITCERDGAAISLTSVATATINISDGTTITKTGGACSLLDVPNGIISYVPSKTDVPQQGTYFVDVKLTYSDDSYEILYDQLRVRTRLPIVPVV